MKQRSALTIRSSALILLYLLGGLLLPLVHSTDALARPVAHVESRDYDGCPPSHSDSCAVCRILSSRDSFFGASPTGLPFAFESAELLTPCDEGVIPARSLPSLPPARAPPASRFI